ncbi:MAG: hypothetical protein ACI8XO_000806 [Verrucomicrobiales bacterium]
MKLITAITALAIFGSLQAGFAQEGDDTQPPDRLADFRETFEKAMATRSIPASQTFASGLEALMRARSQRGDYLGAIRARDRRVRLLAEASTAASQNIDGTSRKDEVIVDIASGTRSGSGIKLDSKNQKLIGLSKTSQQITWDLSSMKPVSYRVIVTYSCGEPKKDSDGETIATGGAFTLVEATGLNTGASEPLSRNVESTGGWDKPITRNIGKLKVSGSLLKLVLSISKSEPGGLMHLHGMKLVPDLDVTAEEEAVEKSSVELEALHERFLRLIYDETKPIIAGYGNQLRSLLEASPPGEAAEIQKEFEAAKALSLDPSLIYQPQPESE